MKEIKKIKKINKNVIVNSFAWKLSERFFSQGINLLIQIVLARILAPSDFGSLAIIIVIINYSAIFVQSGLSTAIIQREDLEDLDIDTLLWASLIVAFIFYWVLFFAAPCVANYYSNAVLIKGIRVLAIVLFLNAIYSIQTAILSRNMKFKNIFLRSIIAVPVSGILGIILALNGFGIWALIVQNITNIFLTVILMCFGIDYRVHFRFSAERAKLLYSFSIKIMLTSMITGLHDTVRTMAVGKCFSVNELAYYDKAYTYSGYVTNIVNQAISGVLLPVFSRNQTDYNALKNMARTSIRMSAFIMFPVLLGVAAVSKPLVLLLLTEKWENCIPLLIIFCILRIPGCLSSVDKQVFFAVGKSGTNLLYELILCSINLIVLYVTVHMNVTIVAIGATIVEITGFIIISFIAYRVYKYSIYERLCDIAKPAMCSFAMAICVWMINCIGLNNLVTLCIQLCTGVITYISFALILRDSNLSIILKHLKKGERGNEV